MKIEITKKNIIITPAPKKTKKNGLKLSFSSPGFDESNEDELPTITTDIIKGQKKYQLPPYCFIYAIKSIEV